MIYVDVGPNTAIKGKVMIPLDDDRVEYAQVQHNQTETSHPESVASKFNIIVCMHLTNIVYYL